ncbi:CoA-binding protein [Chrysiogenes arsenatis]|uniref:CoA-binding protein n=1 Tax=Chrysiogenes arsenatis TaxID=309797 RepID=UPI0003F64DD6|nr:CoA-binding protein [Chrysiogenes arsenatis]
MTDVQLRELLTRTKTIAVVGYTPKEGRAANSVTAYLHREGYHIIPVNPAYAGQTFFGATCLASLDELSEPVDMVNIFQRSENVPPFVDQAISGRAKSIWMQLGIAHEESANKARTHDITVVMDACLMVEHARIFGKQPIH